MNWWIFAGVAAGVAVVVYLLQRFRPDRPLRLEQEQGLQSRQRRTHGHRRRGVRSTRYEAALELERQSVLPAPAPLAGDGDKGIFNGRVVIDVPKRD